MWHVFVRSVAVARGFLLGCSCASPQAARDSNHATARDTAHALPSGFCADATAKDRLAVLNRLPQPLAVEPLIRHISYAKFASRQVANGALLVLPAPEGVSPAWLQRTLTCHEADVVLGRGEAADADPVVLPTDWVAVAAYAKGGTLVVRLEADNPDLAQEVLTRAQAWANKRTDCNKPVAKAAPAAEVP